jgi:hypothetical protein
MIGRTLSSWLHNRDGSASVEFVVIFLGFISIMFFVMEVALYMFFMASLEKAAEAGVRFAVTSPPVVGGMPPQNVRATTTIPFGTKCSTFGACQDFSTRTCSGDCSGAAFNRILAHMQGFNGAIGRQNVTVSYSYAGIGFAGGPTVPMVTVRVSGVPYQTGIFGLLLQSVASQQALQDLRTLPARSASMTGEDLAQ